MSTPLHHLAAAFAKAGERPPSSELSQSLALELAISEHHTKEEAEALEALEAIRAAQIAAIADAEEAAEADAEALIEIYDSDQSPASRMQVSSDSDSEWQEKSSKGKKKQSHKRKNERRQKDKSKVSEFSELDSPGLSTPKSKIRYSSVAIDEFGQFQNKEIGKLMYLKPTEIIRLKAAVQDEIPGALLDYAACHRYGYCKLTPNFEKAFDYVMKVVKSNKPDCVLVAKWILYEYYSENLCSKTKSIKDESERQAVALRYLKEAASGGLAVAINDLGHYYEKTENLPKAMLEELLGPELSPEPKSPAEICHLRYKRAYELYERAANLKLNHAEYNLAQCFYREDFYVPEKFNNKEEREKYTQYWLFRAANNRYQFAINELEARYPELHAKCIWKNKTQKIVAPIAQANALYHKKQKTKNKDGQAPAVAEPLKKLSQESHLDSDDAMDLSSDDIQDNSPGNYSDYGSFFEQPNLSGSSSSSSDPLGQEEFSEKINIISRAQLQQIEHLKMLGLEFEKENAEDEKIIKELMEKIAKFEQELNPEKKEIPKNIRARKFA